MCKWFALRSENKKQHKVLLLAFTIKLKKCVRAAFCPDVIVITPKTQWWEERDVYVTTVQSNTFSSVSKWMVSRRVWNDTLFPLQPCCQSIWILSLPFLILSHHCCWRLESDGTNNSRLIHPLECTRVHFILFLP